MGDAFSKFRQTPAFSKWLGDGGFVFQKWTEGADVSFHKLSISPFFKIHEIFSKISPDNTVAGPSVVD